MSFVDTLVAKGLLTQEDATALEEQAAQQSVTLESLLTERGIPAEEITAAKGEHFKIPSRSLKTHEVAADILQYIPEESVRHYQFVPLGVKDGILEVGIVDPDNLAARDALQFISTKVNLPYKLFLISQEDFEKVLENYKSLSGEVTKALSELEGELATEDKAAELEAIPTTTDEDGVKKIVEEAPATKIVATILRYAIEGGASDIHIEPVEKQVRVRFRVDGVMQTNLTLPKKVHSSVVARIKVLANMRLDERRKPQDNRFPAHIEGKKIDFRVSTFPTYYGEKVVMRILDSSAGVFKLEDLGFSERNINLVREAIRKPYGMILISGPTGSGKTSTLYAMLQEVDRETKNVLSLEDPVEYSIEGINQSQVRPEIGYTFANGLRTTLRQDPDVIMVGEIRDKETAQLAIQAALTGHLVLSTIHTNSAVGIIPRLLDMGVDPYLIPPTIILGMAQRLTRRRCPDSGEQIPVEGSVKMMIDKQFEDVPPEIRKTLTFGNSLYKIKPTKDCPKGTKGRLAVFEMFKMNGDLEKLILSNAGETELEQAARKQGMLTMKEDALLKALNGDIPFEEVNTLGGIELSVAEEAPKKQTPRTAPEPPQSPQQPQQS